MIEIEGKIISRELFTEKFICDLNACKGACCVEGDSGAPLTEEEATLIAENVEKIYPFLPETGKDAIVKQGAFVKDPIDGELVTPLANGKECAFTVFDENNTAKCGIEIAFKQNAIDFNKPISCHLYPIRLHQYSKFLAVNYHQWQICKAAVTCGIKHQVKVYEFLKEPLIRKFGEPFYKQLQEVDEQFF